MESNAKVQYMDVKINHLEEYIYRFRRHNIVMYDILIFFCKYPRPPMLGSKKYQTQII